MSFLKSMFNFLCEFFFGCSHEHTTRPFTIGRRSYRVCLDCGAERPYSVATWSYVPLRELHERQMPAKVLAFSLRRSRENHRLHEKAA